MKFENMEGRQNNDSNSGNISRRVFLRTAGIFAAGSFIPKALNGIEKLNPTIIEKNYSAFDQNIKAVLSIYNPKGEENKEKLPFYFNMHDNEETSVDASRKVMNDLGGKLLELRHNGERLIKIKHNGKIFSFDPNRIFTKKGVEDTLQKYNGKNIPKELLEEVEKFGSQLLEDFDVKNQKVIISLHNNFEGGYSVNSYREGGDESKSTDNISINPKEDIDNFFYVTKKEDFNKISDMGYNVVLQAYTAPDDGSLAVFAGEKGIRYINIEAEHDHVEKQEEMIRDIYKIIV